MSAGNMKGDHYYAEFLMMMREQGGKDNPVTLQLGIMQSPNSVKVDDLILNSEDLYIADYLVAGYSREIRTPYVSEVKLNVQEGENGVSGVDAITTEQSFLVCKSGLKKGDLVAVQKLSNNNKYVILARVVSV